MKKCALIRKVRLTTRVYGIRKSHNSEHNIMYRSAQYIENSFKKAYGVDSCRWVFIVCNLAN